MRLVIAPLVCLLAGTAAAESEPPLAAARGAAPATYDVGFRVGGYGFKREGDHTPGSGWTECRMNGLGIFATRALPGPLFVEAGLDMYTSADFPLPASEMDLPIDRMSGLLSVAIGARTQLAPWLRGYVQLGAGVELTRVAVPFGEAETIRDTLVMPEGFVGVGLDLRVARRTYLGASLRSLVMGNFNYRAEDLRKKEDWGFGAPSAEVVFDPAIDFAAQGQFYLRREL